MSEKNLEWEEQIGITTSPEMCPITNHPLIDETIITYSKKTID